MSNLRQIQLLVIVRRHRRIYVGLAVCLLCFLLLRNWLIQALAQLAFISTPPEFVRVSYLLLDAFFETCKKHDARAVIGEGTLLSAKRFGFISPWDHDIEVRMASDSCWQKYKNIILPEMNSRFGISWSSYVEVEDRYATGYRGAGGCAFNELMARWEVGLMVRKLWHDMRNLPAIEFHQCHMKRARESRELLQKYGLQDVIGVDSDLKAISVKAISEWGALPADHLEEVLLRHPRGYTARVVVPKHSSFFLEKYGTGALNECVPDVRLRTIDLSSNLTGELVPNIGQQSNGWALLFSSLVGKLPCQAVKTDANGIVDSVEVGNVGFTFKINMVEGYPPP